MSVSTPVLIALTEAQSHVEAVADQPLEDRLRAAMKATHRHWMATNEDDQFKAAIGAVMMSASEDEKELLKASMDKLNALGAMLSGVPVDFEQLAADDRPTIKLVPLWNEVRGETV